MDLLLLASMEKCSVSELMSHLLGLLCDESAVAVRLALVALKLCLPALINSYQSAEGLKALLAVFKLKDNAYWLVKVLKISACLNNMICDR